MTYNNIARGTPPKRFRSQVTAVVGSSLMALAVASVFTGQAIAAAFPRTPDVRFKRALDARPKISSNAPAGVSRPDSAPELSVEPIAIREEAGLQSLDVSVTAPRTDTKENPINRYALSWSVRRATGETVIPDLPRVAALNPDATDVHDQLSVPLDNLAPGFYELGVLVGTSDAKDESGWGAEGLLHFQVREGEILLVSAQEWVWETLNPRETIAQGAGN